MVKVGKVCTIKDIDELRLAKNKHRVPVITEPMLNFCGNKVTISDIIETSFGNFFKISGSSCYWADWMCVPESKQLMDIE